ncbi:MAG: nucleoside triphosphate pyrophosphohydrolase [Paludibacteraceae bacterium]|nr:nucleoside triphosphate pyrophosphohydrolase [Paludibacteraceae bacterium]
MHTREEKVEAFGRLVDVIDRLRVDCPWDRKQTFESLRTQTIEEVYELCSAILKRDYKDICKEAGDVLMHMVFYGKLGSELPETERFDIADVCNHEADKLIFRHPHVYGTVNAETAEQVLQNWEDLKLKERDGNKTVLGGVPDVLPALVKAMRIQDKARSAGFDWDEREQVWDKVREEIGEFEAEVSGMNEERMAEEFGDVLFSLINAARLYHINPENALERTNQKFIKRFNYIEAKAKEQGRELRSMTLDEMETLWQQAKHV